MITKDIEIIKKSAQKLLKSINFRFKDKLEGEIVKDFSQVGGGAMPLERLDTYTVALKPISITTQELEYGLRRSFIPIITRVYKDRVIIDVRTLFSEDYKIILDALTKLL